MDNISTEQNLSHELRPVVTAEPRAGTNGATPSAFDLSDLAFLDTADMTVEHPGTGEPTEWVITYAGPGHPTSVVLGDEIAKRAIRTRQAQQQAQTNGKKWKPEDETPDSNRDDNARYYAKRMLGWRPPVRLERGAAALDFSQENARKLLVDARYLWLYRQITAFLAADAGFIQSSEMDC